MKLWCVILVLALANALHAQATKPSILNDVGIDQRLGVQVPADLTFTDDMGRTVRLGDYFGKRPIIRSCKSTCRACTTDGEIQRS